jgi:hypothetical protein
MLVAFLFGLGPVRLALINPAFDLALAPIRGVAVLSGTRADLGADAVDFGVIHGVLMALLGRTCQTTGEVRVYVTDRVTDALKWAQAKPLINAVRAFDSFAKDMLAAWLKKLDTMLPGSLTYRKHLRSHFLELGVEGVHITDARAQTRARFQFGNVGVSLSETKSAL